MTISDICTTAGWQTNGNNVHRLPGVEFLPAGPGALQPAEWFQSVHLIEGKFVILERHHEPVPGPTWQLHFWHTTVAEFATLDELLAWLDVHGKRSEGGMPAGSCGVWD